MFDELLKVDEGVFGYVCKTSQIGLDQTHVQFLKVEDV